MSTVRLIKDDQRHGKKGDVVTVPFLEARDLVQWGIAERPGDAAKAGAPHPGAAPGPGSSLVQPADTDHQKLADEHKRLTAGHRELSDRLRQSEDVAAKSAEQVAKLSAENKKLAEQVKHLTDELAKASQPKK